MSLTPLRRDSAESVCSVIHNSDLHTNLLGDDETDEEEPLKPFRRWVSTLRRRKKHQSTPSVTARSERWMLDDFDNTPLESRPLHAKTGSISSSIKFVAGVKSATVTLASNSIAPLSRRASKWRRTHNRSSVFSGSDPRPSIDTQRSVLDEASKLRSRKRREKLEELIRTEESYVADLRALSNVRLLFARFFQYIADNTGLLHTAWPSSSEFYPALRPSICPKNHRQDIECPRRAARSPP